MPSSAISSISFKRVREAHLLARSLDFNEFALGVHDHVHVDFSLGVLAIVEIEQQQTTSHQAHAYRRNLPVEKGSS